MYKNLLVAVDGSSMKSKVIAKAVEEAVLREASLTIIRVLETPQYLLGMPKVLDMMSRTKKFLEDELSDIKEEISQRIPADQISYQVEEGNPKEKILELVQEEQRAIDLLIIGATGESEERNRGTTGSTAAYLINVAPCDVWIVKK